MFNKELNIYEGGNYPDFKIINVEMNNGGVNCLTDCASWAINAIACSQISSRAIKDATERSSRQFEGPSLFRFERIINDFCQKKGLPVLYQPLNVSMDRNLVAENIYAHLFNTDLIIISVRPEVWLAMLGLDVKDYTFNPNENHCVLTCGYKVSDKQGITNGLSLVFCDPNLIASDNPQLVVGKYTSIYDAGALVSYDGKLHAGVFSKLR